MAPSVPRSRLVAGWGQICWVLVEGCCYCMMVAASCPYPAPSYQTLTKQRSWSKLNKQTYIYTYTEVLPKYSALWMLGRGTFPAYRSEI